LETKGWKITLVWSGNCVSAEIEKNRSTGKKADNGRKHKGGSNGYK
jgi:hypothetical protein